MAMIESPRTAPFGAISVYRAVSAVDALYTAFRNWAIARQTEKTLRALTDRELDDIGLSRGTIGDLADAMARYQR
ncbi:MAG: DUF1127 domain-containing protein [Pseudomonadota bacterium]